MATGNADAVRKAMMVDNPWWGNPNWTYQGHGVEKQRPYLEPFCDRALNLNIKRSTILMGPRRVGKTVMLMQLISRVLNTREPAFAADRIFFASLDNRVYGNLSLDDLILNFEAETGCGPDERRLIIFDEIQYLKDWERHLKVLTDRAGNAKFIASGSATAALRLKSVESGAGRFTDFYLPPLTFIEYLDFTGKDGNPLLDEDPRTPLDLSDLNRSFIDYLNFGGFPEAALVPEIRENIELFVGGDIIDKVMSRDLPSFYGIESPQNVYDLLSMIAWNPGQEVSLEGLSQRTGVSKPTLSRYLEYLEAAMLIKRVRRLDDSGKTFHRNRNFKIYLTSPSLRAAIFGPVDDSNADMLGHLVENALFAQVLHSTLARNIHYARWKTGQSVREIDMVLLDPVKNPVFALEVKWSDRIVEFPQELSGLVEFSRKNPEMQNRVIAATKTHDRPITLQGVDIYCHPCALWCLAWGRLVLDPQLNINNLDELPLQPT